jgi:membrane protease YdiL (CAAX protease family)
MTKAQPEQPVVLPTQTGSRTPLARGGYFWFSAQPLHILLFLLPIIVVYELGTIGVIGTGTGATLEAQDMLVRFFNLFGVLGLHLPALALVVTLLIQHILSKVSWKIQPNVLLAMIAESTFLTGPLVILGVVIEPVAAAMVMQGADTIAPQFSSLDATMQGIFLAFGAGLYEEMLFRLVLITILHFVVTDVLGFKHTTGMVVAVVLSSLAFAWHHNGVMVPGSGINWRLAIFYTLAGAYFGVLFLARGLGIAVGVHLMYDLLVFVVMPGIQSKE